MTPVRRLALAVAVTLVLWTTTGVASTDLNLPYMGPSSGWFMPVGVDLGYAVLPRSSPGALLGGEISAAYFNTGGPSWYGAFASGAFVTNANQGRFSIGPEVGFAIFGVDGGFLDVVANGQNAAGFTLRGMLTLSFITLYGRWDHTLPGSVDAGQVGVLLKYPMELTGKL